MWIWKNCPGKSNMNPIETFLQKQSIVILDGAMATELEARGCDLNDELWSARVLMEQPELIRQVHLDYFNAGADVAITASYPLRSSAARSACSPASMPNPAIN